MNFFFASVILFSAMNIYMHIELQLKMFEEMHFTINRDSPIYKRFRLKVLGRVLIIFFDLIFIPVNSI